MRIIKKNKGLLLRIGFIAVVSGLVYYSMFWGNRSEVIRKNSGSISGEESMPPTASNACASRSEGHPIITSLSPRSGSVGMRLYIKGCDLAGFEGDRNIWIENDQGIRGLLHGETGSSAELILVTLPSRLCQEDTSYRGASCDAWLTLTPGMYRIYAEPWGKKSNDMIFTVR